MVSLKDFYGRAQYYSLSSDLVLNKNAPKVLRVNANGHKVILPDEYSFASTDPLHFYIINAGAGAFWVEYLNTLSRSYYSINTASGDESFNAASGGLSIAPPGSWIDTVGFSNGANNGTFQVTQRNATGTKVNVSASLVTETVNVTPPVFPATTPLPPVTISRKKVVSVGVGNVARLMLGDNTVSTNFREWYCTQRAFGAAYSVNKAKQGGASHVTICQSIPTPPPPPPPPPPYDGQVINLSSCPATKTVTISGGTNSGTIWNGVWTVTLNIATTPPYYRKIIDSNHWVELRYFPGGQGFGYIWQVILHSLTGHGSGRYGNNTAGTCPPNATYTCFPVVADNARCYAVLPGDSTAPNGPIVCVVST